MAFADRKLRKSAIKKIVVIVYLTQRKGKREGLGAGREGRGERENLARK